MLKGTGRIYRSGRSTIIRVPHEVAKDSVFPFRQGEQVTVQIINNEVHIISL
jgi:antitoxin component of MazEF toxin-antitoxin module